MGVNVESIDIPAGMSDDVAAYREALIDAVADWDEEFADLYLSGEEISELALSLAIRRVTLAQKFVGVIPGSAFKNKGVQNVLDAVVSYLPSPLDMPAVKGHNKREVAVEVEADDRGPLAALAFKLWSDPFVGKLVYIRVYSGVLRKGDVVYNPRTQKSERVSRLLLMKADSREDIECCLLYTSDAADE